MICLLPLTLLSLLLLLRLLRSLRLSQVVQLLLLLRSLRLLRPLLRRQPLPHLREVGAVSTSTTRSALTMRRRHGAHSRPP